MTMHKPDETPPSPVDAIDTERAFSPAMLVDQATPENAQEIADLLVELLADEDTPEDVHVDLEARLRSLYHRCPSLTADE